MSCVWVLKNIEKECLYQLWNTLGSYKLGRILELLYLCLVNFEYKVGVSPTNHCFFKTRQAPTNKCRQFIKMFIIMALS